MSEESCSEKLVRCRISECVIYIYSILCMYVANVCMYVYVYVCGILICTYIYI